MRLGLVAPACAADEEKLAAGVGEIEALGHEVALGPDVTVVRAFNADDDLMRAQALTEMLTRDDIDAVVCVRGGFGASRLLPLLDASALACSHTPFMGFSDITSLHLFLARESSVPLIWGPMAAVDFAKPMPERVVELSIRALAGDLAGEDLLRGIDGPMPLLAGAVEAGVVGGTMCLLSSSLGTPWELDCEGKILLLEDIDEELYRIDRYLTQLRQAGKLDAAAGFILGQTFAKASEGPLEWTIGDVLREHIEPLGKPAVWNVPTGHADYCLPVPLSSAVRLVSREAGACELTAL